MAKKKRIENKLSTFTSAILGIFVEEPFRPKNYKQVCKVLGIRTKQERMWSTISLLI